MIRWSPLDTVGTVGTLGTWHFGTVGTFGIWALGIWALCALWAAGGGGTKTAAIETESQRCRRHLWLAQEDDDHDRGSDGGVSSVL